MRLFTQTIAYVYYLACFVFIALLLYAGITTLAEAFCPLDHVTAIG